MSVRDLAPTEGWLKAWLDYSANTMMSPIEFRLGVGLATLSATIGRTARTPRLWGDERTAHIWICLVGAAGHNKSTPLRLSKRLVKIARGQDDAILPRDWSPAGFAKALHAMPDGYWDAGELARFLRVAGRADHMAGSREWLCDVWDGDEDAIRKRLSDKQDSTDTAGILAPTAAFTARPADFEDAASLQDFRSGFFSRFLLFATNEKPDPGAYVGFGALNGDDTPHDDIGHVSLARQLHELRANTIRHPDVTADHEAVTVLDAYDRAWQREADDVAGELAGWAKRRGIQALKLAILHAISMRGRPAVTAPDAAWGCQMSAASWQAAKALSLDSVGLSHESRDLIRHTEKARQLVRDAGGQIHVREIQRALHLPSHRFDQLLRTWIDNGEFEIGKARLGQRGPEAKVISLPKPTLKPVTNMSQPVTENEAEACPI